MKKLLPKCCWQLWSVVGCCNQFALCILSFNYSVSHLMSLPFVPFSLFRLCQCLLLSHCSWTFNLPDSVLSPTSNFHFATFEVFQSFAPKKNFLKSVKVLIFYLFCITSSQKSICFLDTKVSAFPFWYFPAELSMWQELSHGTELRQIKDASAVLALNKETLLVFVCSFFLFSNILRLFWILGNGWLELNLKRKMWICLKISKLIFLIQCWQGEMYMTHNFMLKLSFNIKGTLILSFWYFEGNVIGCRKGVLNSTLL